MAKTFTIEVKGDPKALVRKAENTARANGASLSGDEHSGRFSGGGVEGRYERSGTQLTITIESKPFLVSWSLVESRIRGFFEF